jgi:hypothetical protein
MRTRNSQQVLESSAMKSLMNWQMERAIQLDAISRQGNDCRPVQARVSQSGQTLAGLVRRRKYSIERLQVQVLHTAGCGSIWAQQGGD